MDEPRIERARAALDHHALDALLVGPGADLRYLVGYDAPALERLTLLLVTRTADPLLVVPRLEEPRARASGAHQRVVLRTWEETEDPIGVVRDQLRSAGVAGGHLGVADRLWSVFTLALQAALPDATWSPGSMVMRDLRIVKDPDEIEALRRAGAAIDAVHARVPELLAVGRRESEAARDIAELILQDHDSVNFVIVASGPNGASPHHEAGDRRLTEGDAVVVDIGGTREGYCSDATRDYVIAAPPEGYEGMHAVLERAQQAAVEAVRPGVDAQEVDAAARRVIADAGYGDRFVHRTGHGIGIEEHEEPWIVAGNQLPLERGMAFSVEPGIYLPDRYGARIEDVVVVTDDGVERLNRRPRAFAVCP